MEENKNVTTNEILRDQNEERSFFNFRTLFETFILNWQWFALSVIILLGITAIYLRYTTPRYSAQSKMLIKDEDNRGRNNSKSSLSQPPAPDRHSMQVQLRPLLLS